MEAYADVAPSLALADYDYIQIVPLTSYRRFFLGNDGAQAFRHKATGWTIPDYCRQEGGCPEIWNRMNRKQVDLSVNSPVWSYLVVR